MSEQQGRVSREVRGSLFLIGLDRAAKRNAFDSHMIHDLSLALTEYEDDPSLRCAQLQTSYQTRGCGSPRLLLYRGN